MSQTVGERLHCISTLIQSTWTSIQSSASGFFFQQLAPADLEKTKSGQGQWRMVEGLWLVTNRHVVIQERQLASSITFRHRKIGANGFEWVPITLSGEDLKQRCSFHQDDDVDVAVVNVQDLMSKAMYPVPADEKAMAYSAVSEDDFPGANKITVEVGDDVLVVGYPRGFYDEFSKFPIVKSGIIASSWGMPFSGRPFFLIDAKLFPGSSGSVVISKPIGFLVENKQILQHSSGSKQFAFLGIFSGEPFRQSRPIETDNFTIISKEGYNVGVVWYYHLVTDIIKNGKQYSES
jgi:S1-C subfamily serine protease